MYVLKDLLCMPLIPHFDSFKLSARSLDLYGAHESINMGFARDTQEKDT